MTAVSGKHICTCSDTFIHYMYMAAWTTVNIQMTVLIIDCPVLNWFNEVLNWFNTFPVSITQYRRGCVLQQHCCPIQIQCVSVKS